MSMILIWVVGLIAIWWIMPVGPSDGWQPTWRPPAAQIHGGFLRDGRTLITLGYRSGESRRTGSGSMTSFSTGPIYVWDFKTGELKATHCGSDDGIQLIKVLRNSDLLVIDQLKIRADGSSADCFLRLLNPWTGEETISFKYQDDGHFDCWTFARDEKTVAFVTGENGTTKVEVHDVPGGKLRITLPNCRAPVLFSPDGRLVAARRGQGILVFDIASGRELELRADPRAEDRSQRRSPQEFSRDGKLLLDSVGSVWDLTTREVRFAIPLIYDETSTFGPDDNSVAVVVKAGNETCLAFYDVRTGQERFERRLPLSKADDPIVHLVRTPDSRFYAATVTHQLHEPSALRTWLARLASPTKMGKQEYFAESVLIDCAAEREVARCPGWFVDLTPDYRQELTAIDNATYALWDVPPRKPYRWLLQYMATWTALSGLICWIAIRRRRTSAAEVLRSRSDAPVEPKAHR